MAITQQEKDNSSPVVIVGADEMYAADVNQVDATGKKRLCVDAVLSTSVIKPSQHKLDYNLTEVTYAASAAYTTIFSVTGKSGLFFGCHVDSDTDKLQLELIIDGVTVITDLSVKNIKDFSFSVGEGAQFSQNKSGVFTINGQDYDFSPYFPIAYETSISIGIKKTDNNSTKIRRWIVRRVEY